MTDDEIDALVAAATPGPWTADDEAIIEAPTRRIAVIAWIRSDPDEDGATVTVDFGRDEDAAFIAASRSLVPDLLARAQRAEGERDEAVELLRAWLSSYEEEEWFAQNAIATRTYLVSLPTPTPSDQ